MDDSHQFVEVLKHKERLDQDICNHSFALDRESGVARLRCHSYWPGDGTCNVLWIGPIDELLLACQSAVTIKRRSDHARFNLRDCKVTLNMYDVGKVGPTTENQDFTLPKDLIQRIIDKLNIAKTPIG